MAEKPRSATFLLESQAKDVRSQAGRERKSKINRLRMDFQAPKSKTRERVHQRRQRFPARRVRIRLQSSSRDPRPRPATRPIPKKQRKQSRRRSSKETNIQTESILLYSKFIVGDGHGLDDRRLHLRQRNRPLAGRRRRNPSRAPPARTLSLLPGKGAQWILNCRTDWHLEL